MTEPTLLAPNPLADGDFPSGGATLSAHGVSAWFGVHKVLERVSLTMAAGEVTALNRASDGASLLDASEPP